MDNKIIYNFDAGSCLFDNFCRINYDVINMEKSTFLSLALKVQFYSQ